MKKSVWLVLIAVDLLLLGVGWWYWQKSLPREHSSASPVRKSTTPRAPAYPRLPAGSSPRNVVIVIGDGMGFAEIAATRLLQKGLGGQLALDRFPITGWHTTHAADGVYTDSAAGATALATGHKCLPGQLGVTAQGVAVGNLFELARERGRSLGVLTDSYLWDATPAGFTAHCARRKDFVCVSTGLLQAGLDLAVGTEVPGWSADDADQQVRRAFQQQGFVVAEDLEGLREAHRGSPLLGLFPALTITPRRGPSQLLPLVELALDRLAGDPGGFLLLVETEETDTGSHANDLERTVRGVAALDAVVERVAEFAVPRGDTLVLVTADHETGGLALLDGRVGEPLDYRWATDGHNGEPVPIYALGPGAELFTGTLENTDVAHRLAELLGGRLETVSPTSPTTAPATAGTNG